MATVKLYKGLMTDQNIKQFQCATFNFEDSVLDQDYTIVHQETRVMPTTGEDLRQIRISIPLEGINYLSGYSIDSTSLQNLLPHMQFVRAEKDGVQYYDFANVQPLAVGTQPADWTTGAYYKYYIQSPIYADTLVDYIPPSNGTWDSTAQYYQTEQQALVYYTDSTGYFGVSHKVDRGVECMQILYNVAWPLNTDNFYDQYFWKVGGMSGTAIYNPGYYYRDYLIINERLSFDETLDAFNERLLAQMINFTYNEVNYTGVVVIKLSVDRLPIAAEITALSAPFWKEELTPARDGPTSYSQGGAGRFGGTSNDRGDPTGGLVASRVNSWNAASAIFNANQNRYRMTTATAPSAFFEAQNRLWMPSIWNSISNNFFNPKDAILACHMMPEKLGPPASGGAGYIKAAEVNLSVNNTAPFFAANYTWCHVGSISITDPHWYDGFPDFDNTAIYIHLPYIGTKQIDVEAVMEGTLSVEYVSDVQSGDVVAWIWTQDRFGHSNYHYEFKGNCAQIVPLSYRDKTMGGAIGGAVAGIGARIAIGAVTGGVSELIHQSAAAAQAGSMSFGQGMQSVFQNGSMDDVGIEIANKGAAAGMSALSNSVSAGSSGAGTLSSNAHGGSVTVPVDTQCYLIIKRPKWSNPEGYARMFGYPSDIGGVIKEKFSGFLSVRSVVLDGITGTDNEKAEIATLLSSGVYLD